MMKKILNKLIRTSIFLLLGVGFFILLQRLLLPKWNYPQLIDNTTFAQETYYAQEKDIDDVLFFGTSHVQYGISPMEIYKACGITSYNMSTSAQRVSGTYFLLKEALQTQSPKVVVLDVSSLFLEETNETAWRLIMDTMPLSSRKIEMAKAYTDFMSVYAAEDEQEEESDKAENLTVKWGVRDYLHSSFLASGLLPIIKYHTRWESLTKVDFRDYLPSSDYFSAGYLVDTTVINGLQSVRSMNETAERFANDTTEITVDYVNGIQEEEPDILYSPEILEQNAVWLERIRVLCESAGTELLLIKVPAIQSPQIYGSSWTKIRSDYMKEYALENGYTFFDLLYDADTGIKYKTDFKDGGRHLNYQGAVKVSDTIGAYLAEQYGIAPRENVAFDANMPLYDELSELAKLQLTQKFVPYLQALTENEQRYVICISAKDDAVSGLKKKDIKALQGLGLRADFTGHPAFREAYLAVIDGGELVYEAASNRELSYDYEAAPGLQISAVSSGWNTGALSSITVNGEECSTNGVGLNIVVIDKATELVLDSVSFNTYEESPHPCSHRDPTVHFNEYWLAVK